MIEYRLTESFNKGDQVKVVSDKTYFGKVTKDQYHQWLYTNQGIFNLTLVKAYRIIERYEDHGVC